MKLPPPEQWLLTRLNEMQLSELIERHIDYVDPVKERSVHLPTSFVRHYRQRHDDVLPTVVAIATLPIVLADGGLLCRERGLDRERGIVFRVPKEIVNLIPQREDCTAEKVASAMKFLSDDWLCDVETDYEGKCTIVAAAMTVIERSLLNDRPAFFITAGRRGVGKTTTLTMLVMAVAGLQAAASAWSSNEEERRKALMSYFLEGVAYIIWDNIPRGAKISCPHVEKSCTAAYYSDRKLGVSEIVATAASTIHFFTGNNIGPKGDLASRSLHVRLETERPDPENREFSHADPVGWTEANRVEILVALYTILLGNPMLNETRDAQMKTRFKMWYRLVGSAVENAAALAGGAINFRDLFRKQDEADEDEESLAEVLAIMKGLWPTDFRSSDLSNAINAFSQQHQTTLREFFYPQSEPGHMATAKSVGRRLNRHVGEPVRHGDQILVLKSKLDPTGGGHAPLIFEVVAKRADSVG